MENDIPEKPEECQGCEYETPDLDAYNLSVGLTDRKFWLCEPCASTHAASHLRWTRGEYDDSYKKLAQQIAWSTNYLRDEIRRALEAK